ncbi:MAG: PocR ligand-binding domain-containing protein [Chloroflexi bacterium]|nr:PocR ligand-binding domain-containing protein [Chloroflexota bacterium]
MDDLLTTKQLQELLKVDRTTIYRMLSDGRLTGIRVGGQWRFPRATLEQCLVNPKAPKPAGPSEAITPKTDFLPLDCLEPIQDIFATAADVGAVTTSIDGKPLIEFSNSCAFCRLVLASPVGRERCQASWARLAQTAEHAPRVERCHAGLSYARGRIQVGQEFVGMLFAGQFVTSEQALESLPVDVLARECSIPGEQLKQAARDIRIVEPTRVNWLLTLLQKTTSTFSHIGTRQLELIGRLRQVAQIARV